MCACIHVCACIWVVCVCMGSVCVCSLKHFYSRCILVQELFQKRLIPQEVIPKWHEFGIELGFNSGEIDMISDNAVKKAVEKCS